MKQTLSTYEVMKALRNDPYAKWSYEGAQALAEYMERAEEDCGEEWELDIVQLRCDWSEYATATECAGDYGWEWMNDDELEGEEEEEAKEQSALDYLQGRTTVIEFVGGVIVANF
jgi:hypothetical protein